MGKNVDLLLGELKQQSLLLKHFIEGTAKRLERFNHDDIVICFIRGPSERKTLPGFQALQG